MNVAELYGSLGLEVNAAEWSAGDAAIKRLDAELKKLAVDSLLATKDVNKAMGLIGLPGGPGGGGKDATQNVRKTSDALAGFARQVATAFAVSQVGTTIKGWVTEVMAMGAHVDDTTQTLGIGAAALQELGYAAEVGGSSAGELEGALKKLNFNLAKVKEGGPAAETLKKLGLSIKDVSEQGLDENLEDIAEKFKTLPDGAEKSRMAMSLFGRSGATLIPFLNNGAGGIAAMREEAQKLGIVMSAETAKGLADLEDNTKKLGYSWQGLKVQVVSELMPSIGALVDGMREWIAENREAVASALTGIVSALGAAFKVLGVAVAAAAKVIAFFVENSDVTLAVVIALGIAMRGLAWSTLKAAGAWLLLQLPIIATVAAIAAVAYGVIYLIRNFDKVKVVMAQVWESLKVGIADAVARFKAVPGVLLDAFSAVGEGIISALEYAFDWVVDKAKRVASEVWDIVKDIPVIGRIASGVESVVNYASDALGGSPDAVVPEGGASVTATFGDMRVEVNATPGMDVNALAELAAQKAVENQKGMLADAAAAVRGGRR